MRFTKTNLLFGMFAICCLQLVGNCSHQLVSPIESDEEYIVETTIGQVRGLVYHNQSPNSVVSRKAAAFLNIPFAEPPIGRLRFEKPVGARPWSGVRNATAYGPACFPHVKEAHVPGFSYSENCLSLNVITPAVHGREKVDEGDLLPVLFYIHGGGFEIGAARYFPIAFQVTTYALKDVVLVTVQYRLGPLGFASNGQRGFGGNLGYWDQLEALRFIRANARAFGGDPERITLWGNSAGAVSVAALTLSTHSRDLFSQAIQMSGSIYAEWGLSEGVVENTRAFANVVHCDGAFDDAEGLKRCLQSLTIDEIQSAADKIGPTTSDLNFLRFQPRFDEDFFIEDPVEMIEKAPKKPTIIGVNQHEAIIFSLFGSAPTIHNFTIAKSEFASYGLERFLKFVSEFVSSAEKFGPDDAALLFRAISEFYLGDHKDGLTNSTYFLTKHSDLISDVLFVVPAILEAKQKAAAGWPVHFYLLDQFNDAGYPDEIPVRGAFHVIDLNYLFDTEIGVSNELFTVDDYRFRETFIDAVIEFARNGNPSTAQAKWPPIKPSRQSKNSVDYLLLNASPTHASALFEQRFQFWQQMRKAMEIDPIRNIPNTATLSASKLDRQRVDEL